VGYFSFFDMTGFALRYTYSHFPTFKGNDVVSKQEVPIPMEALVATLAAVSAAMYMQPNINHCNSYMPPFINGAWKSITPQNS
jgi:hypothetical protein